MMQGVMFGGEGPIMQGTWYNPSTGDAFVVLDSYFEDNQYIVKTTDGRFLKYNQIQNYVQTEMSVEELKRIEAEKKQRDTKRNDVVPPEVQSIIEGVNNSSDPWADMMIPEDMDIHNNVLSKPLGNINERHIASVNTSTPAQTVENLNTAIIDKALKDAGKPKFTVTVNWEDYPEKQIELLKDVMNIPVEEILDWYLDNITIDELIDLVKDSITNKLCPKKDIPNPLVILEEMVKPIKPSKTVKPTQSKTKKSKNI